MLSGWRRCTPWLLFVCAAGTLSACAGLLFQRAPVQFDEPYSRLGVIREEATAVEKQGVLLRVKTPPDALLRSREESTVYANIREGKGLLLKFVMDREDWYGKGGRPDSYRLRSETRFQNVKGTLFESLEQSDRGEIVRFFEGFHRSKIGKFRILDWKRTPAYPETPVKPGDTWNYEESMEVRIDSFWIKEKDPQPYRLNAACKLEGFARVQGVRCAMIETRATQIKREHFKILFKEIIFDIHSEIADTVFLNYVQGVIVARITRNRSFTQGINVPLDDEGRSQSVYYLLDGESSRGAKP